MHIHHLSIIIFGDCTSGANIMRVIDLLKHIDAITTKNFMIDHFGYVSSVKFWRTSKNLPILNIDVNCIILLYLLKMFLRSFKSRMLEILALFNVFYLLLDKWLNNPFLGFSDCLFTVSVFKFSFFVLLLFGLFQSSAFSFALQKVRFGMEDLLFAMENLMF